MAVVIELSAVTKSFGSARALDGIDAAIEPGVTALVGANGAGKTTLLRILLGQLAPDHGRVSVLGHAVPAAAQAVRERVGYLPESPCLPSDVPAAEFVAFMAQLGGLPPRHARERASELCYQVGLGEERYRPIGGFSTGMKQRVKLAQALVHDPALVLLDEPTDGMDPAGRADMLVLIARLRRELGVDVLLSTHLLSDVERVCDRVVMLAAGRILAHVSVSELGQRSMPVFSLELGDNGETVRAALASLGLEVSPDRSGRLLVRGAGGEVADLVRDLAAERGWPLWRLTPQTETLEQAFLELQRATARGRVGMAA